MDVENRKKKRRIPPNLRRRALVSCDRCKQRRVRCIRPVDAEGNEDQPCQSCIETGVKCESKLPRKQRIYGSVENLSFRYRVLDGIVKGLYPDQDTSSIETLISIAKAHNIPLPDPTEGPPDEHAIFRSPAPSERLRAESTHSISSPSPTTPARGNSNANPFESHGPKVIEEKLIPAPHGAAHYIGPSSSFSFVVAVRNLVAEYNAAAKSLEANDERVSLRADFVGLRNSRALEPHANGGKEQPNPAENTRRPDPQRPTNDLINNSSDAIATILPAREVADALVEAYFDRVHPNYLIFHRGTFQVQYESIWVDLKRPIREFESALICSVFMMFVFGAQVLEHHDGEKSAQLQRQYLELVQSRTYQLLHTTSLLNVQAILLLQLHQHNASERNTSWALLGCASRMALSLGMHREGATGGFDSIEKELRRRIWWTLYVFEQNLCAILGRPSAIDDSEVTISLPNENMLDGADCVPPDYLDHTLRLTRILSEIKRKIYATPNSNLTQCEAPDASVAESLLDKLEAWHRNLPAYLRLECLSLVPKQRRAVLLLHIQYRHVQSIVTRPFVLRKAKSLISRLSNRQSAAQEDLDAKSLDLSYTCGTSARNVASLLQQLATNGMFEGVVWQDAYYLYHCILILSLDFLARPASQKDTAEDEARKTAVRQVLDSVRNMKLCPTFTILNQVSLQFAKIVGIFDERAAPLDQDSRGENSSRYAPPPAVAATDFRQPNNAEGVINNWFQSDRNINLPWEFFGHDSYAAMNQFYQNDMPVATTLSGYVSVPENEPPRVPITPGSMYSGWPPIAETYPQSTAGPGEYTLARD